MNDAVCDLPDPGSIPRLDEQLCFPLYACAKEVARRYREPLALLDLTYTQYLVMMVLWEHGTVTEGQLGRKVLLDSGTLAPLLKRLEKQGLVIRTHPRDNERTLEVSLTQKGDALREEARNIADMMQGCLTLSLQDQLLLHQLLSKALTGMYEDRQTAD